MQSSREQQGEKKKKVLLKEQCKEIEENNRRGKSSNLFKKTGDIEGTLHIRMGSTQHRDGRDPTEAGAFKKSWQERTAELYKKGLHGPGNHAGVATHPEPDILQWEVKRALGSIATNEASGGDGIPAELCKILKDAAAKVLHSICQHIWKTQQWP